MKRVAGWFGEEHVPRKWAALAFCTGFPPAPTVLLPVLLFGLVVNAAVLRTQPVSQSTALSGGNAGGLIEGMLRKADPPRAGLSAVVAIAFLAVGATTTFHEFKDGLDDVPARKAPASTSLWDTIRAHILSFGVFVSIGFLLRVSLAASAALAVLSDVLNRWFGLEAAGRVAIGLYLGRTDTLEAFGAAGPLAVVLVGVCYSSLAFYAGALVGRLAEERARSPAA